MYKKIIMGCLGLSSPIITAMASPMTQEHWTPTLSMGIVHFNSKHDQALTISDYLVDSLVNTHKKNRVALALGLKKPLPLTFPMLNAIMVGPALYYQHAQFSGDVFELGFPGFFNYTYHMTNASLNGLLEADAYLKPLYQQITPFVSAGVGVGMNSVKYNDFVLPGIPKDSERHFSSHSKPQAVYALGAGLSVPIGANLKANIRYLYTHNERTPNPLLKVGFTNQAVMFGISIIS